MVTDCTFVTCRAVPALDPDDRIVLDELERRGISTGMAIWDDTRVDWSGVRLCVLRSTWDYHTRYREFADWIDRVAALTTIRNEVALLRWNAHKSYLSDLAERRIPIVPTVRVRRGQTTSLDDIAIGHGWNEVVIKPTRGAAAHEVLLARRSRADMARGRAHLERLLRAQDALVQPFLRSVATYGERALVFFDGRYSHAVIKKPFDTVLVVDAVESAATKAGDDEIAVAAGTIAALPSVPLYARVDLLRGDAGQIYVSEVELIEPGLYIGAHPPAGRAFADAIERELLAAVKAPPS
jgi:glutathione synthase/RimK-type ligase-like ATP-grasp enzyme